MFCDTENLFPFHFNFLSIPRYRSLCSNGSGLATEEQQPAAASQLYIQHTHQCHFPTQRAAIELCMLSYAATHFDYVLLRFSLSIFKVIQRKAKE